MRRSEAIAFDQTDQRGALAHNGFWIRTCRWYVATERLSPVHATGQVLAVIQATRPLTSPGPSRCFPFWQELLACYVVNTDNADDVSGAKKCIPALEDYYECLHHRKEVSIAILVGAGNLSLGDVSDRSLFKAAKITALQSAYRKAEAQHPRENAPKAGQIRSLGLLGKDEDTKAVMDSK